MVRPLSLKYLYTALRLISPGWMSGQGTSLISGSGLVFWPTMTPFVFLLQRRYDSTIIIDIEGGTIGNVRKSCVDEEAWAAKGEYGFYYGPISRLGTVAIGIC